MIGLDSLLGGLTGLVGNAVTTWFKYKNIKLEHDYDTKMLELKGQVGVQTLNTQIKQTDMQIKLTEKQVEGEVKKSEEQSYQESQKQDGTKLFHEKWVKELTDAGKSSSVWIGWFYTFVATIITAAFAFIDFLNSLMRPFLTLYLVLASSYITHLCWVIMKKAGIETMTANQAVELFQHVTSTMIYLTVSCVTWWFGDRTMAKFLQDQSIKKNVSQPLKIKIKKPSDTSKIETGGGDVEI